MAELVLSLFPGIGLLDMVFEEEGFCVVRGPDALWGGDIRRFHPPHARFDGVIGGPPCQAFSRLAHMVRHNGHEPKFGNLIPEFERCVFEAKPQWFLMENVPDAPVPDIDKLGGLRCHIHSFLLNNRQLGEKQNRVRRWSFGYRGERRILNVETVVFENPEFEYAACGIGQESRKCMRRLPGTWRSKSAFESLCRSQGLPDDFDLPAFKVSAKCKAVSNGIPLAMGRAIAKAVKRAVDSS